MEIIALAVSSFLLFRTIIKPTAPKFSLSDRLTESGALYNVSALSTRSAALDRSGGITGRKVLRALKKTAEKIKKSTVVPDAPLDVFYANSRLIVSACEKAARAAAKSYMLGSVNGVPRVFTLCDGLVKDTRGEITAELLTKAVSTFNASAPLGFDEIVAIPDMLRLCVCGLISVVSDISYGHMLSAEKGKADGESGKINLDMISDDEYVCGLCSSLSSDVEACYALLRHNGISTDDADVRRRKYTAELAAVMKSCVNSLEVIDAIDEEFLTALSPCDEILSAADFYAHADAHAEFEYLKEIDRLSAKRKMSETSIAREIVETSGEILYTARKDRAIARKITVIAVTLALFAAAFAAVSATVPRVYLWLSLPTAIIIYSCAGALTSTVFDMFFALRAYADGERGVFDGINNIVASVVPVMQLILFTVCARYLNYTVFTVALLPLVTDLLCAVFLCAAKMSVKPSAAVLSSVIRLGKIPSNALFPPQIDRKVGEKTREIVFRTVQAAVSIIIISVAAAFGNVAVVPIGALFFVFAFFDVALFPKRRKRKHKVKTVGVEKAETTVEAQPIYFRLNSPYSVNLLDNASVYAVTDSRGAVNIRHSAVSVRFDMQFDTPFGVVSLGDCDGVSERHRTAYRAKNGDLELSAEIIVPPNVDACLCRTSIVNRSARAAVCDVAALCLSDFSGVKNFERGVAASIVGGYIGVMLVGDERFEPNVENGKIALRTTVAVGAFSKVERVFAAVFEKNFDAVKRCAREVGAPYFERSNYAAKVYAALGVAYDAALAARIAGDEFDVDPAIGDAHMPTVVSEIGERNSRLKKFGFEFNSVIAMSDGSAYCDGSRVDLARAREISVNGSISENAAEFMPIGASFGAQSSSHIETAPMQEREYELKTPFGGLLSSGELFVENASLYNRFCAMLSDGEAGLFNGRFYTDGNIPTASCGVAIGEKDGVPHIFGGDDHVVCGFGYTDTVKRVDGLCATLTQYMARGKGAAIFDLELENLENAERTVCAMFFCRVGIPRPLKVGKSADAVYVTDRPSGKGFAMLSSAPMIDCTPYREGYCRRDTVVKLSDFGRDGIKIAPAISVACNIEPNARRRVVFCVAAVDGIAKIDKIDVISADRYFAVEKNFVKTHAVVMPHTTDRVLDYLYSKSFYDAYIGYLRERGNLPCHAAKFCDADGVKKTLISNGKRVIAGEVGIFEMLGYVSSVKDFVDYTGDDIFSAPATENATVADCCIYALDTALSNSTPRLTVVEYAALLRAVQVGCECFRRKRYFAVLNDLKSSAKVDYSGCGAIALLAQTFVAFENGDAAAANDLLRRVGEKYFNGVFDVGESFCAFGKTYNSNYADFAAAYHAVVTKYLFGINFDGGSVEFYPHTSAVSPHIEYEIFSRDRSNKIRVIVEDGENIGGWLMRVGNITCTENRVSELEKIVEPIILFRNNIPV